MYASACFVAVYQDIGQDIQQLRTGKAFGEGLYGPLSIHKDDRISCLRKLLESMDEGGDQGTAATTNCAPAETALLTKHLWYPH